MTSSVLTSKQVVCIQGMVGQCFVSMLSPAGAVLLLLLREICVADAGHWRDVPIFVYLVGLAWPKRVLLAGLFGWGLVGFCLFSLRSVWVCFFNGVGLFFRRVGCLGGAFMLLCPTHLAWFVVPNSHCKCEFELFYLFLYLFCP